MATTQSDCDIRHTGVFRPQGIWVVPYPEFAMRFREACQGAGLDMRQKALGKAFGVSGTTAWNMLNGTKMPSMPTAARIARRTGVCVEWLLTGRGPKHPLPDEQYVDLAHWIANAVPQHVDAVISLLKGLRDQKPGPIMLENKQTPDKSRDRSGKPMLIEHRTTKDVADSSGDGRRNGQTGTDSKGNVRGND